MKIQIHVGTVVFAGYDDVGNPVHHQVDVALNDKRQVDEDDASAAIRVTHLALHTLAHTVGDLLMNQNEDVIDAALKQIGFMPVEDDDEDEDENEGDQHNEMPDHPDQRDPRYGWNDGGKPSAAPDSSDDILL